MASARVQFVFGNGRGCFVNLFSELAGRLRNRATTLVSDFVFLDLGTALSDFVFLNVGTAFSEILFDLI